MNKLVQFLNNRIFREMFLNNKIKFKRGSWIKRVQRPVKTARTTFLKDDVAKSGWFERISKIATKQRQDGGSCRVHKY